MTPEQLGQAYKKAVAAGDMDAASEIASALNATVASAEPPQAAENEQPVASFNDDSRVFKDKTTRALEDIGLGMARFPGEVLDYWGKPMVRAMNIGRLGANPDAMAARNELYEKLKPTIRMAPSALSLTPQYQSANLISQVGRMGLGFAAAEGLAGGSPIDMARAGVVGAATTPTFGVGGPLKSAFGRTAQYVGAGAVNAAAQGSVAFSESKSRGDSDVNSLKASALPAVLGGFFGGANQFGRTMAKFKQEAEQFKKALPGIPEEDALAFVSPSIYGNAGARAEALGVKIGVEEVEAAVSKSSNNMLSRMDEGAKAAAELQPFVGALDDAEASLATLSRESVEAHKTLAKAKVAYDEAVLRASDPRAITMAKGQLLAAAEQARAVVADDIAKNAHDLLQIQLNPGRNISEAETRNLFIDRVMTPMAKLAKGKAKILQEKINFPSNQPFVSGKEISDSVQISGGLPQEEIDRIMEPFVKKTVVGPKGKKTVEYRDLSREDIQHIRQKLWDRRESTDVSTKLQTATFGKMDKAISSTMEKKLGEISPESLSALRDFNAYWANQTEALKDPSVKSLFSKNAKDGAVQQMTDSLVKSGVGSDLYQGTLRYIDAVGDGSAKVKQVMKSHVHGLIRDNLLDSSRVSGSQIDLQALSNKLDKLKERGFSDDLGFNAQLIADGAKYAKGAGLGTRLSGDEFAKLMESPAIKNALSSGTKVPQVAKKIVYEIGALRAAKEAKWMEAAGMKRASARMREAEELAKKADMSRENMLNNLGNMKSDPLYVAFSGKKNFGLRGQGMENFTSFLDSISNTDGARTEDVRALLSAIGKKSPELREQIAIHQLSRTMEYLVTNQAVGRAGVNWQGLGDILDPSNKFRGAIESDRLRLIIGDDAFGKLRANLPKLEIVRKVNMARQEMAAGRGASKSAVSAGTGVATGKSGAGQSTTASNLMDWLSRGYYWMASTAITVPGVRKAMDAGASFEDAVKMLGPQRAYIIMQNGGDETER